MSGTPSVNVVSRELLIAQAAGLADELRREVGLLDRDARALDLRGLPMFAANLRTIRGRLATVMALALEVAEQGGTGRRPSRRSRVSGQPGATFSTGAAR